MASHLSITVQEAQATITSTEFLKWTWYLNWKDTEEFNRQDFYLAQIAAEVRRTLVKHPKKIKAKDFILKFNQKRTGIIESNVQKSKKMWLTATGIRGNKRNQKKRKASKPRKVKE